MLPNTFTIGAFIWDKVSEDKQSGTQYVLQGSPANFPSILTIKHDVPGLGKAGTCRHLMSVSQPMLDTEGIPTSSRVTVNLTVTYPRNDKGGSYGVEGAVQQAIGCMLQQNPAASPISTGFDTIADFGYMFLKGHH